MNQTKLVEAKKRKSQSESDIKSICFITFEYKHIENYPNKKSQSQAQLLEYYSDLDSKDDQQDHLQCQNNPNTLMNYQQVPSLVSIFTSESNISAEEEFEIWDDNSDLRILKIVLEEQQPSIRQFLNLYDKINLYYMYKARFGGFPGQQQCIQNEEVIKTAINYASTSKQLFKKYFPSKRIVFEDDIDIFAHLIILIILNLIKQKRIIIFKLSITFLRVREPKYQWTFEYSFQYTHIFHTLSIISQICQFILYLNIYFASAAVFFKQFLFQHCRSQTFFLLPKLLLHSLIPYLIVCKAYHTQNKGPSGENVLTALSKSVLFSIDSIYLQRLIPI